MRRMSIALLSIGHAAVAAVARTDPPVQVSPCVKPAVTDLRVVCDRWPDATDLRRFGLDACRLENAKTDEEKALAVWRWMRRCAMKTNGRSPREGRRWVDASKILNVYGAHHCGGLSLTITDIWRAMGYPARRLYRHGHTLGDLWYTDADGVGRFHMFDNNYGWFCYTRDGSRIATAEEIGADFSLNDHPSRTHIPWIDKKMWMWGWCHMPQFSLPGPRWMNLHPGETVERLWDNVGKPHDDNVGVREWDEPVQPPYERKFGNGVFRFESRFQAHWRDALAAEPVNVAWKDGEIRQADPAQPAELRYRVLLPYIVSEGHVLLKATGGRIDIETDRGKGWRPVKPMIPYTEQGLTKDKGGPPGRYSYLLRVRLLDGAVLDAIRVDNVVQLNMFSLPALLAGENRITLKGAIAEGHGLEVAYNWTDVDGEKTHRVVATALPFEYTIQAAGTGWKDVVCRSIITRVVPVDKKGNRVLETPAKPSVVPDGPFPQPDVRTVIGPKAPPTPRTTAEYVTDLASTNAAVRRAAAAALTARPDEKAWDALVKLAYEDITQAKLHAVQALFWTNRKRAAPVLRKILNRDPAVKWPPEGSKDELPIHSNVVGTIAAMSGLTRFRELVPELNTLALKTSTNARWACLRALGRINDPRGYPAIRRFCRSGNHDTATVSNEAAGRVCDPEAIKNAARWIRSKKYPIRTLKAIEAVGKCRPDEDYTDLILWRLRENRHSEDWRATVSLALAEVGDPAKSRAAIEKMLGEEQWPWVKARLQKALERLEERGK